MSLEDVLYLKTSAKRARNDKDWGKASRLLGRAVAALDALGPTETTAATQKIITEYADIYGVHGGVERRWGLESTGTEQREHLERSKNAYDKGYGYERELGDRAATYNRVNRIVARALVTPEFLLTGDDEVGVQELADIESDLQAKLDDSEGDPWAQCDLVMIQLLRGDPATDALDRLEAMAPRRFVYDSLLDTLRPLAEATGKLRPHLVAAVAEVERQQSAANP